MYHVNNDMDNNTPNFENKNLNKLFDTATITENKKLSSTKIYARLQNNTSTGQQTCVTAFCNINSLDENTGKSTITKWWKYFHKWHCSNKIKEMQWKIFNDILYLNNSLMEWNLVDNNMCTFCTQEIETPIHLFLKCNISVQFWTWCFNGNLPTLDVKFLKCNNLFQYDSVENSMISCAKYNIYTTRCRLVENPTQNIAINNWLKINMRCLWKSQITGNVKLAGVDGLYERFPHLAL